MTSLIEKGLVEFLTAFFEANDVTAVVHPGTSGDQITANDPVVVVNLKEARHEVGPLYTGDLELIVSTPAIPTANLDLHRELVSAVEQAFDPTNSAAISSAVQAASDCTVQGWFIHGPKDSQGDDRWHTTLPISLGLMRAN